MWAKKDTESKAVILRAEAISDKALGTVSPAIRLSNARVRGQPIYSDLPGPNGEDLRGPPDLTNDRLHLSSVLADINVGSDDDEHEEHCHGVHPINPLSF